MMSMQYVLIKYIILCTGETKMCKIKKSCSSRGVVGFSEFRGKDLTRGKGKNSGGSDPRWSYALGRMKYSALLHGHILKPDFTQHTKSV